MKIHIPSVQREESDDDDDDRRELISHYANEHYLSKWELANDVEDARKQETQVAERPANTDVEE